MIPMVVQRASVRAIWICKIISDEIMFHIDYVAAHVNIIQEPCLYRGSMLYNSRSVCLKMGYLY